MLSALIKVQPRGDGSVLDPLAIVNKKEKAPAKGSKKPKEPKKVKEQKRPRKCKVVPASDNEDDEADFSEFVPLKNAPKDHFDGYVDEEDDADCGILSPEKDNDDSEWSEFVKEEEERYAEKYETGSSASQSVEGSLSSAIDPDEDYDTLSADEDSFEQNDDDDVFDSFPFSRKQREEPKQPKVKAFRGIAIFEDQDWIP